MRPSVALFWFAALQLGTAAAYAADPTPAARDEAVRAAEPAARDQAVREADPNPSGRDQSSPDRPLSLGARGIMMPGSGFVGGFGVGIDVGYSLLPNLALGITAITFTVDQGADPHYCSRCIRNGNTELLLAEGRLWPQLPFTPYARLGAGHAHLKGQKMAPAPFSEDRLTLLGELGVEMHYKLLSMRGFGFYWEPVGSPLDEGLLLGFGLQLGVRL